ncbi:hypothetical protein [Vulcanococcus limneticus]|uniref:hypothetical protein n=1 Tax=Vulcanococcus limneticus TaxID=2170428 RepID=UPI00398C0E43
MDSRRLVVWIAAGILGFQGGTLVLDLLNCSVLSWLYVRRHGLELSTAAPATAQKQPVGEPPQRVDEGGPEANPAGTPSTSQPQSHRAQALNTRREGFPVMDPSVSSSATPPPIPSAPTPFDPTGVFCDRPRSRIDAAVSQGLSILAGLALGGSGVGGGKGDQH